jgi:hypothetical protein
MLITQEDVMMKTNKFMQTIAVAFLTVIATTMPAMAKEDRAAASFERELNHQPGTSQAITRNDISTDVLYQEINQSLYSTTDVVIRNQTGPDQVLASFMRELNHKSSTPAPVTRTDIDTDVLYAMVNDSLQSRSVSNEPGLNLLARSE